MRVTAITLHRVSVVSGFISGSFPLFTSVGFTWLGTIDWLRENGVEIIDLDSQECKDLLGGFISEHPEIWNEDIGED